MKCKQVRSNAKKEKSRKIIEKTKLIINGMIRIFVVFFYYASDVYVAKSHVSVRRTRAAFHSVPPSLPQIAGTTDSGYYSLTSLSLSLCHCRSATKLRIHNRNISHFQNQQTAKHRTEKLSSFLFIELTVYREPAHMVLLCP